jgi:hypothetical protein
MKKLTKYGDDYKREGGILSVCYDDNNEVISGPKLH